MAYAMMYPETKRGMGSISFLQNCNNEPLTATDKSNISRARFIFKNDREKAELVRDGHPDFPLSKTYDAVKEEAERRKQEAEEQRRKLEQLTALRGALMNPMRLLCATLKASFKLSVVIIAG